MPDGSSFEEYLTSKKIDSNLFRGSEPLLWDAWKNEFEKMHPNSFTIQKLNLINPIRRKYRLPVTAEPNAPEVKEGPAPATIPVPSRPVIKPGRPVIRPKGGQDPAKS